MAPLTVFVWSDFKHTLEKPYSLPVCAYNLSSSPKKKCIKTKEKMSGVPTVASLYQDTKGKVDVDQSIDKYSAKYADSQDTKRSADKKEVVKERVENSGNTAETFYNLVTDFYEYGWGPSFHFSPIYDGKSFEEYTADYEKDVGRLLQVKPGTKILVRVG